MTSYQKHNLAIFGVTGSIGSSAIRALRHLKKSESAHNISIHTVQAHSNLKSLLEICREFNPEYALVTDLTLSANCLENFVVSLKSVSPLTKLIQADVDTLASFAANDEIDTVLAAIVGMAGLPVVYSAAKAGKRILLANKESLVVAGEQIMATAREQGAKIIPIDSEHNALFQLLVGIQAQISSPVDSGLSVFDSNDAVRSLVLTASGGPFYSKPDLNLKSVTPQMACAHPNWSMGQKISVDSATLMNKGLEVIEAAHLFSVSPEKIDVVIHPESQVHGMISLHNGSHFAQLSPTDMSCAILHALTYPASVANTIDGDSLAKPLNLLELGALHFDAPDCARFRCLALAYQALKARGTAPLILNMANEFAVDAFLNKKIGFDQIPDVVEAALNTIENTSVDNINDLIAFSTSLNSTLDMLIKKHSMRFAAVAESIAV